MEARSPLTTTRAHLPSFGCLGDQGEFDILPQDGILAERLDSATTTNAELIAQLDFIKKKYQSLQEDLQAALLAQSKLEKQFYGVESELDAVKLREEEASRKARDLEFKLKKETKEFESEKAQLVSREEQLKSQIKGLQTQCQQRLTTVSSPGSRGSRTRSISVSFSPPAYVPTTPDELQFDSPVSSEATLVHEAKLANRTVRQQLKEIGELKANINQMNEQLSSLAKRDASRTKQIKLLEKEIEQLTLTNSNQNEEIASYQLLLEERTLRGQFSLGHRSSSMSLTGDMASGGMGGFNLGSELSQAQISHGRDEDEVEIIEKDELQQLKDENKALTLYISKILGKIMSNPVLAEAITSNGDAKHNTDDEVDTLKPEAASNDKSKNPNSNNPSSNKKEEEPPLTPEPAKPASRFGGFLSPTFSMSGFSSPAPESNPSPANSRVSFDLPNRSRPPTLPSINTIHQESANTPEKSPKSSGSQSPYRSRRSKSMSVANPPSKDKLTGEENSNASGGVFSFRTAFKKMAVPWKASVAAPPPIATATAMATTWEEEPITPNPPTPTK